jgi:hypothetical protein
MVRRSLIVAALVAVSSPLTAQEEWVWTSDRPDGEAPVGVIGARTLDAGAIQLTYRFTQMNSRGVWFQKDSLNLATVLQLYDDAPLTHSDQRHAVVLAYGVTDDLTVLAKGQFSLLERETIDGTAGQFVRTGANALGDTEVNAIYNLFRQGPYHLEVIAGGTIPTGKQTTWALTPTSSPGEEPLPYDMRPGSGTFAVLFGGNIGIQNEFASLGGQAKMAVQLGSAGGYTLGDRVEANAWGAYKINDIVSASAGLRYEKWGNTDGFDNRLDMGRDPGNVAATIGGRRITMPVGVNLVLPEGSRLAGHRLFLEAVYTLDHEYEGPQLGLARSYNLGWSWGL